ISQFSPFNWYLIFLQIPKQFSQPDLIEQISQILEDTSLNPSNLKLEITETAIIASPEKATSVLKQLIPILYEAAYNRENKLDK
ncbi:hypothetical protein, partial [Nostoc sp. CALU 1950]|uniref:hypothetical protein n=1 Tax=Nostoc sp. CALU 1950 TaxID=3104321 RepID=UPI003EBD9AAA